MEEAILVVFTLLLLLTTFCLYKMLDKRGLYFSLVIFNLIAFVLSFKISNIFKMNINIGIIPVIGIITIFFLFILKYGQKEKKNLLAITLYSNVTTAVLLAIMNYFEAAITETISINMEGTFQYNYKILIVYPIILGVSEYISIKLFDLVNQIQSSIIVSGILTYIITGLVYTVGFYLISYINILEVKYSLFIGISSYILGLVLSIINIIILNFLYKKKVI